MSAFTDAMRKQFPDLKDASDADILAEAKQRTGFRGSQRAFNVSIGATPRTTGAARLAQMFGQGASFGWGDELAGAAAPIMQPLIGALDIATGGAIGSSDEPGLAGAYKSAKLALEGNLAKDVTQIARGELQMAREDAPLAAMGAEMAGGLASAVGGGGALGRLGAGIAQTTPNLGRAIQAVGQASTPAARIAGGAMGGGLYGAGAADGGDRMQGAMHGAMLGGLMPPAASAVGKIGSGAARVARGAANFSPTAHLIRAAASGLAPHGFKTAAREGVTALYNLMNKADGVVAPAVQRVESAAVQSAPRTVLSKAEARAMMDSVQPLTAGRPPVPGPASAPTVADSITAGLDMAKGAGTISGRMSKLPTPEAKVVFATEMLGKNASVKDIAAATALSEAEVMQASRNLIMGSVPGANASAAQVVGPTAPPVAAPPVAAPPVAAPPASAADAILPPGSTAGHPPDWSLPGAWLPRSRLRENIYPIPKAANDLIPEVKAFMAPDSAIGKVANDAPFTDGASAFLRPDLGASRAANTGANRSVTAQNLVDAQVLRTSEALSAAGKPVTVQTVAKATELPAATVTASVKRLARARKKLTLPLRGENPSGELLGPEPPPKLTPRQKRRSTHKGRRRNEKDK